MLDNAERSSAPASSSPAPSSIVTVTAHHNLHRRLRQHRGRRHQIPTYFSST
ncbi:hypothetical protein I552_10246 [Mycobacterium xenopi 3993]|nr:hypothetical protein I552_10246 [Mycobacterium xenopi 3993]